MVLTALAVVFHFALASSLRPRQAQGQGQAAEIATDGLPDAPRAPRPVAGEAFEVVLVQTSPAASQGPGTAGPDTRNVVAAGRATPPAPSLPSPPVASAPIPAPRPAAPRAYRPPPTTTLRMLVTAYCPCPRCCGRHSDGKTASGKNIHTYGSRFVAADTHVLAFGTKVSVPGYHQGIPVPVLDRGGRIKGHRLDVFFLSHQQAKQWGARWLDVTVYLGR